MCVGGGGGALLKRGGWGAGEVETANSTGGEAQPPHVLVLQQELLELQATIAQERLHTPSRCKGGGVRTDRNTPPKKTAPRSGPLPRQNALEVIVRVGAATALPMPRSLPVVGQCAVRYRCPAAAASACARVCPG